MTQGLELGCARGLAVNGLDHGPAPGILGRMPQVIVILKVHPKIGSGAGGFGQASGHIGRHRAAFFWAHRRCH